MLHSGRPKTAFLVGLEGFLEEVGVVDGGAVVLVEFLRSFAAAAAGKDKLAAAFGAGPV